MRKLRVRGRRPTALARTAPHFTISSLSLISMESRRRTFTAVLQVSMGRLWPSCLGLIPQVWQLMAFYLRGRLQQLQLFLVLIRQPVLAALLTSTTSLPRCEAAMRIPTSTP